MRRLYNILIKRTVNGLHEDKEEIWRKLYGAKKAFNDQQLRLLYSYLLKVLEQYIQQKELENQAEQAPPYLLLAYRKRGLTKHFQRTHRKLSQNHEVLQWRHPEYHLQKYTYTLEQYQIQSAQSRTSAQNLQELEDELTIATLSMKLRQACNTLAHQTVYKMTYQIALPAEFLALSQQPPFAEHIAVRVYYLGYLMLCNPEEEAHFSAFKIAIADSIHCFPTPDARDLFLFAINYCIRKINEEKMAYLREALDIYQKGIEDGVLLYNGRLSHFTYHNAVGIALRLEEHEWTASFLEKYRPLLNEKHRDTAYHHNFARLAYAQRQYGLALQHLQQADYKDLIHSMVAKTLQLKIYYEIQEFALLDAHLKSVGTFLGRKEKMSYHHHNYYNIVRMTKAILALPPNHKKAADQLRQRMQKTEPLTERNWLLAKLNEVS
ncbi:MAG: hypothetical protein DHS20C18_49880 [Saprospiraceae bacterium]|nr:MAG: hypothetical protein DHS20C18_49880 [Saprospiraceae bacterium]